MKKRLAHLLCTILTVSMVLSNLTISASAFSPVQTTATQQMDSVTVTDAASFMNALTQGNKIITVDGSFTVSEKAIPDKSIPLINIPENTTIIGTANANITSRLPIQITGDNVRIENLILTFNSTNGLNSVPHREIFLAGHSLSMVNVRTYLKGGDNALLGTEPELLPTVYAGGYTGAVLGEHASLTVQNTLENTTSNLANKTMFQSIYMGHPSDANQPTAYTGDASLTLQGNVVIRDTISTVENRQAQITFSDDSNDTETSLQTLQGNDNTTLHIQKYTISNTTIDGIGNIVISENGCLKPSALTAMLHNISVTDNACLDLTDLKNATMTGNFTGGQTEAKKGLLVLDKEGLLSINGTATGITQFQTQNRVLSGTLYHNHTYITAVNGTSGNFILSERDRNNNYILGYRNNSWTAYRGSMPDIRELGSVQITNPASHILIDNIPETFPATGDISSHNIPYFDITWLDTTQTAFTPDEADHNGFYTFVTVIRSEDWKDSNDSANTNTDWSAPIRLERNPDDTEHPNRYYLLRYNELPEGDYTFLFYDEEPSGELITVADVKYALKNITKKELPVTLCKELPAATPTAQPTVTPSVKPTVTPSASPAVTPSVKPTVTPSASPAVTPSVKPTVTPSASPAVTPSAKPTVTPSTSPAVTPSVKPTVTPSVSPAVTASAMPTAPSNGGSSGGGNTSGGGGISGGGSTSGGDSTDSSSSPQPTLLPAASPVPTLAPSATPVHTHEYKLVSSVDATCQQTGLSVYQCSCGERYEEEIPLKSHVAISILKKAATAKTNGLIQTICQTCQTVLDQQVIAQPKTITLSKMYYTYNGKAKKPAALLFDRNGKAISPKFYTVTYQNNKKIGQAVIKIHLTGNYSGTLKKTFTILPKGISIKKIQTSPNGLLIKWSNAAKTVTGYEIAYSRSANISSSKTEYLWVKNYKTTQQSIPNLKKHKKYYIWIRTYKTVKINDKKVKFYSNWSKKYVKTV